MNYSDEQRIRRAVYQRDAMALADAIERLPSYDRDYDDIADVVERAGGVVNCDRIRLGHTTVYNRFGRAVVRRRDW